MAGDLFLRLGNPFIWVDGGVTQALDTYRQKVSLLNYFSMYYEFYETPAELARPDLASLRETMRDKFKKFFATTFPFLNVSDYDQIVRCSAETNVQDYLVCAPFLDKMTSPKIVDFGPGLGRHSLWVKSFLKNPTYFGIDISPISYQVQNEFFRQYGPVYDCLEMEQFGVVPEKIQGKAGEVLHIPGWHLPKLQDNIDCVLATFMLNETTTTGCLFLLYQASRLLKEEGIFYLRDSDKLKPARHMVNYDNVLIDLGFECAKRYDFKNRVDFFGVPRVYKRRRVVDTASISFEAFCQKFVGKFEITSQGGLLGSRIDK